MYTVTISHKEKENVVSSVDVDCTHSNPPRTHLRWFKGVVCREVNSQEENPALIRTVTLREEKR